MNIIFLKGFSKLTNVFIVIFVFVLISILTVRLFIPENKNSVQIENDASNKNSLNDDLNPPFERSVVIERKDFGYLAEILGYKTCIEIGVLKAEYAFAMMNNWPSIKAYYGIDPYIQQKNYIDGVNTDNETQNNIFLNTKASLNEYARNRKNLKVELIRKFSSDAVHLFKDESIDLIYLDGRHDYCAVTEDLEAYYPKVKCNGMLAGHDFVNNYDGQDYGICANGSRVLIKGGGVKGAVLDFIQRKGIKNLKVTTEPGPSYYFIKKC